MQRVQTSKNLTGLNICLDTLKISKKVAGVEYAIRDIVSAATKLEKQGKKIQYLNIGDPVLYGFQPPDYVKDALIKAIQKGENYYAPSEGIPELRDLISQKELVNMRVNFDIISAEVCKQFFCLPLSSSGEEINLITWNWLKIEMITKGIQNITGKSINLKLATCNTFDSL